MDDIGATDSPPVLYNATGHEVLVQVGDALVPLPVAAVPQIVDDREESHGSIFALPSTDDGQATEYTLTVAVARPKLTIDLPEETPGVLLLVQAEVLARLPHRRDLLAPAAYTLVRGQKAGEDVAFALCTANRAMPPGESALPDLGKFQYEQDSSAPEIRAREQAEDLAALAAYDERVARGQATTVPQTEARRRLGLPRSESSVPTERSPERHRAH